VDIQAAVTGKRADVIQPDVCRVGGIWEMRKIAVLSEQHDVSLAPKGRCGPVALAASLHVAFAASGVLLQETSAGMSRNGGVVPADYVRHGGFFAMNDGAFEANGCPGLGIEVDEEKVRELHEQRRWWTNPVWRDDLEAAVGW
jgi:galactonate dehydratase